MNSESDSQEPSTLDSVGIQRVYLDQHAAREDILRLAKSAHEIDIWAMRALGLLALNGSLLRSVLVSEAEPKTIRILLLSSESEEIGPRAREIGETVSSFITAVELGISLSQEFAQSTHHNVSIALARNMPVWRMLRFDEELFLSSYVPGSEGHTSQMLRLTSNSGSTLKSSFCLAFEREYARSLLLDTRPVNLQERRDGND